MIHVAIDNSKSLLYETVTYSFQIRKKTSAVFRLAKF